MRRWWSGPLVAIVFVIAGFSLYAAWPNESDIEIPCELLDPGVSNHLTDCPGITLGLDLQGGSRIALQADISDLTDIDKDGGEE